MNPSAEALLRVARPAYVAARVAVNRARSALAAPYSRVYYVIERADWSVRWDGHYIARGARAAGIDCRTTTFHRGVGRQVVHFGSRNMFVKPGFAGVDSAARVVFTWFHGDKSDPSLGNRQMLALLPEAAQRASAVVVTSQARKRALAALGVPLEKLRVAPIGVDLSMFRPLSPGARAAMRARLSIREDAICIGSFQKDGEGWAEGLTPKLVKGPDVFVAVVRRLAASHRVHALLTGPARGYVKRALEEAGVPCTHVFLKRYAEMPPYYGCLDMYLITSRDEGGPKALVESMATGVPLVSTRVGMAPDLIDDGVSGFLADVGDVDALHDAARRLAGDAALRRDMAEKGLDRVRAYDWAAVARVYAERVYRPLLQA